MLGLVFGSFLPPPPPPSPPASARPCKIISNYSSACVRPRMKNILLVDMRKYLARQQGSVADGDKNRLVSDGGQHWCLMSLVAVITSGVVVTTAPRFSVLAAALCPLYCVHSPLSEGLSPSLSVVPSHPATH